MVDLNYDEYSNSFFEHFKKKVPVVRVNNDNVIDVYLERRMNLVLALPSKLVSWASISGWPELTRSFVESHFHFPWVWSHMVRPSLFSLNEIRTDKRFHSYHQGKLTEVCANYQGDELWSWITEEMDNQWDWNVLSSHSSARLWEAVQRCPSLSWNWDAISSQSTLTLPIYLNLHLGGWVKEKVLGRLCNNLSLETFQEHFARICIPTLSLEQFLCIPPVDSDEESDWVSDAEPNWDKRYDYFRKHSFTSADWMNPRMQSEWNFSALSENRVSPTLFEFVEKTLDQPWNWNNLSINHPPFSFLQKHLDLPSLELGMCISVHDCR